MIFQVTKEKLFAMLVLLFGMNANDFHLNLSWEILNCRYVPGMNTFSNWQSTSDSHGTKFVFLVRGVFVTVTGINSGVLKFHIPLDKVDFLFSNMMTYYGHVLDNSNMPRFEIEKKSSPFDKIYFVDSLGNSV